MDSILQRFITAMQKVSTSSKGPTMSRYSGRFWDMANFLTVLRLPLAVLLFSKTKNRRSFFLIMAIAGITDIFDGWFARRNPLHSTSTGEWLDPLCDKIFVLTAAFTAWRIERPPIWIPLLISAREIIQFPLVSTYLLYRSHLRSRTTMKANSIGKATTVFQFLTINAILFRNRSAIPLAILTSIFGSSAAAYYVRRGWPKTAESPESTKLAA
jgi:phosphatidylglycerophosphate synthase